MARIFRSLHYEHYVEHNRGGYLRHREFDAIASVADKKQATIFWGFLYDGPIKEDGIAALQPFDQLQPLSVDDVNIPYAEINNPIGGAINGSLCEPNKAHVIGTANLQVYNVTAQRAIYDLYNRNVQEHPELGGTRVLVEGYAVQGVKSFKSEDSAFPLRDDNILT